MSHVLLRGIQVGIPPGFPSTDLAQPGNSHSQGLQALPPCHPRGRVPPGPGWSHGEGRILPIAIVLSREREGLVLLPCGEHRGLHHALPKSGSQVLGADRAGAAPVAPTLPPGATSRRLCGKQSTLSLPSQSPTLSCFQNRDKETLLRGFLGGQANFSGTVQQHSSAQGVWAGCCKLHCCHKEATAGCEVPGPTVPLAPALAPPATFAFQPRDPGVPFCPLAFAILGSVVRCWFI